MVEGNRFEKYSTNPQEDNSVPILRSENERGGLEFTWSIWLFVKGISNDGLQHVFHKGNEDAGPNGIFGISGPGRY